MILCKIFCKQHEVNYFMKWFLFISMIIFPSSKAAKLHSSQKSPLLSNYNETLSEQDFEDSLNTDLLSEQNYSLPYLLSKPPQLKENVRIQSSTQSISNSSKKINNIIQSKKHRNIIKMVCDSDNLISQMTLHMNFLDTSKDEKHHDFIFKKIFNSDDPKNEISISYPEISGSSSEYKANEPEKEIRDQPVKDFRFSVSKAYNENELLKKDNNMNYLLLNEEYEIYPISKKNKAKTPAYSKDDYKLEIKKFNSGPRMESLKLLRDNYRPITKERKKKNKIKFWVTAMAFTEPLQNSEDVEKNNLLHKLHFPQTSLSLSGNAIEAEESYSDPEFVNNENVIPQVINNIERVQNNSQDDQDISFSNKEYDNENNEGVLNLSKKFKKYKLANDKNAINEIETLNQSDDTYIYDYPTNYNKNYHNEILKQVNSQLDKGKHSKKYKAWKNSLVSQPKMKNVFSSNRALLSGENNSETILNKKKKIQQRQKVIENLKFILSKQNSEHSKSEKNSLQSKHFFIEKPKDAVKILNNSKTFDKKNITKLLDISDNGSNNILFQNYDQDTYSNSVTDENLLSFQNENIPIDIYDIDMNDSEIKSKLKHKELFHLTNNGNNRKSNNQKDINSKFDVHYKTVNKITNKRDLHEQIPFETDDKGEEIREGVFLKKGIPLQFNPYQKIDDLDNKSLSHLQNMSPVGDSQRRFKNKQNHLADISLQSEKKLNSENLKTNVKRDLSKDNTYQKAYNRFLRDIALIKFLGDKYNGDSVYLSE